jgi:hypothetical protein
VPLPEDYYVEDEPEQRGRVRENDFLRSQFIRQTGDGKEEAPEDLTKPVDDSVQPVIPI